MFHASHGDSSSAASAHAASGASAARGPAPRSARSAATAPNAATNTTSSSRAQATAPSSRPASSTRRAVQRPSQRSSTSTAAASATSTVPVSRPLWKSRKIPTEPAATSAAAAAASVPSAPWRRASARACSAISTTKASHSSVERTCESRRPAIRSPPASDVQRHVERHPQRLEAVRVVDPVRRDAVAERDVAGDGERVVGVLRRQRAGELVGRRRVHPRGGGERDQQRDEHRRPAQPGEGPRARRAWLLKRAPPPAVAARDVVGLLGPGASPARTATGSGRSRSSGSIAAHCASTSSLEVKSVVSPAIASPSRRS